MNTDNKKALIIKDFLVRRLSQRALKGENLAGMDFRSMNLSGADFRGASLAGCNFSHAKLRGAKFNGADLRSAHFWRADLTDADFSFANLSGADLDYSILNGAVFYCANLYRADLPLENFSIEQIHLSIVRGDAIPYNTNRRKSRFAS
jgi:uncharacterized protein YjbI with pentapeptide repeats